MLEPRTLPGLPVIGNAAAFFRDPAGFCLAASSAHPGELLRIRFGVGSVLFASDPDHLEHLYVRRPDNYWKGVLFNALRPIFGGGLLLSEGDEWKQQRRDMQPAFQIQRFRAMLASLEGIIAEVTAEWQDGAVLDLERAMRRITMRIILRLMFSSTIAEPAVTAIDAALETLVRRATLMVATVAIPGANRLIIRSATTVIDREVARVIAARRADPDPPADLLTHLLGCRDADGRPLPDPLIRDQVVTTIFGGYEATATALYWMWILLDRHPEVRARVDAELATATSHDQLAYGHQVVQETLRLMPPFWDSFRTAYADDDCGGYRIRANESILISIYSTHHDPRYWPDPERFDPDRFAPGRTAAHKTAFLPFLAGKRSCIGKHIAIGEMLLVLGSIGRRWHLTLADPTWRLAPISRASLRPRGAPRLIAHRRTP